MSFQLTPIRTVHAVISSGKLADRHGVVHTFRRFDHNSPDCYWALTACGCYLSTCSNTSAKVDCPRCVRIADPLRGLTRVEALERAARLNRTVIEGALQKYVDPVREIAPGQRELVNILRSILRRNDDALKVAK